VSTRRWAEQLEGWRIPDALLASVDESPYGWPQRLWKRRSEMASREPEPFTTGVVRDLLGAEGDLIDVGAGRGRASLPLAAEGHRLTAVEADAAMAAGLREDASAAGLTVAVIEGRWPHVADRVQPASVVMSANVVYDCADIAPFLSAMNAKATSAVVIELTGTHPWASTAPLFRALHDLDRPAGPTVEDLVAVVEEVIGVTPQVERWSREGQMWFEDWDEILEYHGRRLVLPPERRPELRPLLEPEVFERDGRLFVGDGSRDLATIWWTSSP
jgi:SAM-dependent methyltransferase